MTTLTVDELVQENEELRRRLDEAEEALRAIQAGEVDAVVVETDQDQVYTLETADNSYRLLVAQVPHPAVTLTGEGSIISCNRRFADLLQCPPASLAGRWIRDLVVPDSRAALEVLMRDGRTIETADTITLLRDDGTPVSVYLGVSALSEGARGLCLMVTDLTEHRHYEELQRTQSALRASEERYRSLFESIDEGFCVIQVLFDESGRPSDYQFLETNPSFESHTGLREVIGKTMRQMEPSHEEHWFQIYGQVALTGEPIRFQNRAEALHRWFDVYAFRIGDSRERKVAVLFNDITERKRTEKALQDADRKKDEFLATLAHELRNPLAPIRNAVQILKAKGPPSPELQWARGVIERQVQHMARLLEDLLDVSRVSRHKLDLRRERVDLAAVVEAAVETSRPLIEAGRHELIISLPPSPICLEADPVRLAQVFANLLNNAAKYTEEGGRIRLSAERQGRDVIVSIQDNGIGIAAEMLPRVFEIFSQEKPALVRSQDGLGIGLSLVKGLVELHGGSVEAKSAGPNRGSEFIVRLPVAAETAIQELAPPVEEDAELPAPKCRVLIVDDNRDSADSLAMILQIMGHEVGTAYDGEQAVEAARASRPDVVLLDIGMPRLNGYDACRRIREQIWGQGMFLIALTGWGQKEDCRRTEEAGFNQHMVKPVDPAELLKLLASRDTREDACRHISESRG
jgi:PAS domain S-box-containing protein